MDIERIRETITATIEEWLTDYGLTRDKSHGQLENRIVAAILAIQKADEQPRVIPPSHANPFACGD
jgi:hypothetical protein